MLRSGYSSDERLSKTAASRDAAGGCGPGPRRGGTGRRGAGADLDRRAAGLYDPDSVLVAYTPRALHAARVQAAARVGLVRAADDESPYFAKLRLTPAARRAGIDVSTAIARLRRDPSVRIAEPDGILHAALVPDDPRFPELWGLQNTGQDPDTRRALPGADIRATEAWDRTTGSASVIVAVLDTGVDYNHPDLEENILRDESGRIIGDNFVSAGDRDPMDLSGHGTHVAGIIGARGNNGIGVVGVCHRVSIMPVKCLGINGAGTLSQVVAAVDFAREHHARVMNASWGTRALSGPRLLLEAIQRARDAGILFVTSAGNSGSNNDRTGVFPANFNAESNNVITVAATDPAGDRSIFSNYGATRVDLAAPGTDILSTARAGGYVKLSGTSMAAPYAAGAAALLLAFRPSLSLAELKNALLSTTDPSASPSLAGHTAHGRLNVANALNFLDGVVMVRPGTLEFGTVHPGTTKDLNVLVTNLQGPGLQNRLQVTGIQRVSGSDEFSVVHVYQLPVTLFPSFSLTVPIRCTPRAGKPGGRAATFRVETSRGTRQFVANGHSNT